MNAIAVILVPSLISAFGAGFIGGNLAIARLHRVAEFSERKANNPDDLWALWHPVQLRIGKWTTFGGIVVGALDSVFIWKFSPSVGLGILHMLLIIVPSATVGFAIADALIRRWARKIGLRLH